MKKILMATAALTLFASAAYAEDAEGVIEEVNADTFMIKLDDGVEYQLPEEVDLSIIGEGMKVALAYDEIDGKKVVTDMEQVD